MTIYIDKRFKHSHHKSSVPEGLLGNPLFWRHYQNGSINARITVGVIQMTSEQLQFFSWNLNAGIGNPNDIWLVFKEPFTLRYFGPTAQ